MYVCIGSVDNKLHIKSIVDNYIDVDNFFALEAIGHCKQANTTTKKIKNFGIRKIMAHPVVEQIFLQLLFIYLFIFFGFSLSCTLLAHLASWLAIGR